MRRAGQGYCRPGASIGLESAGAVEHPSGNGVLPPFSADYLAQLAQLAQTVAHVFRHMPWPTSSRSRWLVIVAQVILGTPERLQLGLCPSQGLSDRGSRSEIPCQDRRSTDFSNSGNLTADLRRQASAESTRNTVQVPFGIEFNEGNQIICFSGAPLGIRIFFNPKRRHNFIDDSSPSNMKSSIQRRIWPSGRRRVRQASLFT